MATQCRDFLVQVAAGSVASAGASSSAAEAHVCYIMFRSCSEIQQAQVELSWVKDRGHLVLFSSGS